MEIRFLRTAHKFLQKCDYSFYLKIEKEVKKIGKDPYLNKPLTGKLKPIRTHHFFFKRSAYRIAYKIEKDIIVIMIATRENFYEKLEQRL